MGQIVSSAAKPKRCNANQLSQVPTPAAGEYILVSSDNSMNAAGQGNFDCYIVGNGRTAATELELKSLADNAPTFGSKNAVSSGGIFDLLSETINIDVANNKVAGAMRITGGVVGYSSSDSSYVVVGYNNPIHLLAGDVLITDNGNSHYVGNWASVITQVTMNGDTPEYTCLVRGAGNSVYEYTAPSEMDVIVCMETQRPVNIIRLSEVIKRSDVTDEVVEGSADVITSGGVYNTLPKRNATINLAGNQVGGGMRISGGVVSYNSSDTYAVVGLTTPIHLYAGDVLTINDGNNTYMGTWCSVITEVANGNYSIILQGVGRAAYQYTAARDMDVIVCKQTSEMPIRIRHILLSSEFVLKSDVVNAIESENINPVSSGAVAKYLITSALKSSVFPNGTNADISARRFFTKGEKNNNPYVNKKLLGLKIRAYASGQISIVKGKFNSTCTEIEAGTYETLQTFNVYAGLNSLLFTNPVTLAADEYLGIDGNVSVYYGGHVDNSTDFYWYNSNTGKYQYSNKEVDIELLALTIPADTINLTDIAKSVAENADGISELNKLAELPFLDGNPCYYHWSPNGFNDNIPSQSIEDNMLAKRLGFSIVEVNQNVTATAGKYVITHGNAGKFGQEFSATYENVLINSMSYDDIVANVKYNSAKACYNHTISTPEVFFKNCAQLGLGVYLRTNASAVVNVARKFLPDSKIVIEGGASVRGTYKFKGMLSSYIGSGDSATICDASYLRNYANTRGGAPYHIVLLNTHVEYMITQGTLEDIVGTLKSEGIYIGVCYASNAVIEQITSVGGVGHAADAYQCNPFCEGNFGSWSLLDSDLSQWTIPSEITGTSDGKLANATASAIVVGTPSTGILPLAKGQVQARIKGDVTFAFGGRRGGVNSTAYTNYSDEKPINLNCAGMYKDMKLTITIGANSSVEFLNYQVSRC